ncbi:MAG: nitroreductase family protein [Bacteroidetes bacterium]|uniref:nitroreductase family protein n=1 Tax=Yoonia sp. TaxID=2212373 RepID=UPI000D432E87|nr:nitroreductase family protein [Yoonia sp.]PTM10391.1 MAG: nitroreductase family protein [Bacteroidota bacterium]
MNQEAATFAQIVKARRAVRKYEEEAPFDEQAVQRSLALAVLAPNSSNLQTWEFFRVRTPAAKAEVARLCMNQSAARTAQEMVVVVCRTDKWKVNSRRILANMRHSFSTPLTKRDQRAVEYYQRNIPLLYLHDPFGLMTLLRRILVAVKSMQGPFVRWTTHTNARIITHKSAALAAQNFMLAMQAEGYATCPMEGFDEKRLKRFLKLPRPAEISMVIATGVPADEGVYSERFRFPLEEVVFEV